MIKLGAGEYIERKKDIENMRDITKLHPTLQEKIALLKQNCLNQGLVIAIGETLRTKQEQDALYAQGRTKPGKIVTNAPGSTYSSMHQWGVAFDFYRNDGQGSYNESGNFFERVGAAGKKLGLEWGGDWKSIVDKPHLQLSDWGSTPTKLKEAYKRPEDFFRTWDQSGWREDAQGRWYRHADGTNTSNDWEEIDGKWYWFDGAGYAVENNWYYYKDKWYYLGDEGVMQTGLIVVDGKVYYMNKDGDMATQPVTLTPDESGALA